MVLPRREEASGTSKIYGDLDWDSGKTWGTHTP